MERFQGFNRFPRGSKIAVVGLLISLCCPFGCTPQKTLHMTERGQLQNQYIHKATQIDYPDVNVPSLSEVCDTTPPLTMDNPDPSAIWDLTLEEAIQAALKNSTVIRTLNGVGFSQAGVSGTPSMLLQSPNGVATVYDPALVESDPRYGQEAALAAFDAQLTAGTSWTRDNTLDGRTENGEFTVGISKIASTGTQFYVTHNNLYDRTTGGTAGFHGWQSQAVAGFTHPLLRGGGIEFNRIAGPGAQVGMYGGVAIARISTDMSLNDFEMAVRNLVADVEKAYWQLFYAYHRLESIKAGYDAALQTWRYTQAYALAGSERGRAQYLAQAEVNYFQFRQQVEVAQSNLFKTESVMRYIMGLTASDGRMIRPIDNPITAPIRLDWQNILCEGLIRSPELRKQKWEVKRRELELTAAKNFLLPRLDLEGRYYHSGSGSDLLSSRNGNAYGAMIDGDGNGWTLGLSASAPFGWRQELAGKRNAELNLVRAIKILQDQELEMKHQLADSIREISLSYKQMQTTLLTHQSSQREVNAVMAAYEHGMTPLDQLLQAQRRQADAETSYYDSVVQYNLAIMTLHYRKGSLLEYNNVCLTEGQWPIKAYSDAKNRARTRDMGKYFNYGFTLPNEVSRVPYAQHQNSYNSANYQEWTPQDDQGGEIMITPDVIPSELETESIELIQQPPRLPNAINAPLPVSYTESGKTEPEKGVTVPIPTTVTPVSTLTPSRNMRYVK